MNFLDYICKLNSRKLIFIIIILIAISYSNSLSVYFVWDDYSTVVSNANIRSLNIKNMLSPMYQDDSPKVAKTPVYYRPVQVLSYSLDYQLWKLNPFGYHITNIILHTANAILLYLLLSFLFKDNIVAFCGAVLFGTHPIFTSSVTYISGRADLFLVFFLLLTLLSFIKSIKDGKLNIFFYGLAVFCSLLLFLSKEIGVVGILFLIMIDKLILKYSIKRIRNLIYFPFVLTLLFWQYLKPPAIHGFYTTITNLNGITPFFLTLLKGMSVYTCLSIIPFHLRMGRTIAVISTLQDKWVYISLIFLIILITLYIIGFRKNKLIMFGLSWLYMPLFIMLFFNYFFAKRGNEILLPEHNLYFCYIGFIIALLSIIASFQLKINTKKYLIGGLLSFSIFYAGSTISENFIWQEELRFFETNIKYNKDSVFNFMIYANLGLAYERAEKFSQAEESYKLSAERSGRNPYFYNMLASFYMRKDNFDKALEILVFSNELDESFYTTYFLLGICYANKGKTIEARHNFEKALFLNPADDMSKGYLETLKDK